MNNKIKRWNAKGKWSLKPCIIGLLVETGMAALFTSIVTFLIFKEYLPIKTIQIAKYIIIGASAFSGIIICMRVSDQRKTLNAAITSAFMLLEIGIMSFLLSGRTGKGLMTSEAICCAAFILSVLTNAMIPRKKYLS